MHYSTTYISKKVRYWYKSRHTYKHTSYIIHHRYILQYTHLIYTHAKRTHKEQENSTRFKRSIHSIHLSSKPYYISISFHEWKETCSTAVTLEVGTQSVMSRCWRYILTHNDIILLHTHTQWDCIILHKTKRKGEQMQSYKFKSYTHSKINII